MPEEDVIIMIKGTKYLLFGLLLLISFAPSSHAATDCAKNCCRTYNASWDTDFDDCRHPAKGYDDCVSQCEAANYNAGPHGPVTDANTPVTHVNCTPTFVLMSVVVSAAILSISRK